MEPVTICPRCKAEGEYIQSSRFDQIGFDAVYKCGSCGWQVDAKELEKIMALPCALGCGGWAFGDAKLCDNCDEREKFNEVMNFEPDYYFKDLSVVYSGYDEPISQTADSREAAGL